MEDHTKNTPKSLIEVCDRPILWYSLHNLQKYLISKYVFVIGYRAKQIMSFNQKYFPNLPIEYIYNDKYTTTNSIYSYYLARKHVLHKNFLRLEGDLLYTPDIIKTLLVQQKSPSSAVQKKRKKNSEEYSVSVNIDRKTILEYGKNIPINKAFGEAKGIEYISAESSQDIYTSLEYITAIQPNAYAEIAYQYMIDHQKPVYYVEINKNDFWCEVDTPEDLAFARRHYKKYI